MTRARSIVLITLIWAAIYLPFLGSSELRSEEGKRVLVAVEMLQRHDFIVPHLGGSPYFAKPPFMNWQIAGAFSLAGIRNEWIARLPSALQLLLTAIVIAVVARPVLQRGALIAAIAWLTNYGLMEKGRMAEIDATYASLFAIATICWLACYSERKSPWLTYTVPWVILGLGLLTKGPAHVVFFYVVVIAVLWRTRHLRDLLHPAHALGLVLMLGVCAAWLVPYFNAVHDQSASSTWWHELTLRITGGEHDATYWPMNFPRGIGYFLPWFLLLLFVRPAKITNSRDSQLASGALWSTAAAFIVVLLLPGTIPRYVLPLLAPACWLIGLAVRDNAFGTIFHVPIRRIWQVVVAGAIIGGIFAPARSAILLHKRKIVTPVAAQLNAIVPENEVVYAANAPFQPYFFYLHSPITYCDEIDDVPLTANYLITLPDDREEVEHSSRWLPRHPQFVLATPEYRGHGTVLFRIE